MARKSKSQISNEIHQEALDRFKLAEDYDEDQRFLAVEDANFIYSESGHWDDDRWSETDDRPRFTTDRISPALDQVIGDQRQTRTQIKVVPEGGKADEQTAKIYDGLIRNIQVQSKADNAYDNAFKETLVGGYGGWRVRTIIDPDDPFAGQQIIIEPIMSAASSYYTDPNSQSYDKRDSMWQFLITTMTKPAFEAEYPDATVTDFGGRQFQTGNCNGWFTGDMVRVAEYWRKVPEIRVMGLLSDDRVIDVTEEKKVIDELAAQGVTIVDTKPVETHRVEMFKMNGAELLTGAQEWAGKFIPLIPAYGKQGFIEGKCFTYGMVRKAKDPSRIYDFANSATVEAVALTPKDPYFYTEKMVEGYKDEYENFTVRNQPFMPYNADDKAPGPPSRGGAPQVQSALIGVMQQAKADIEATTGIYAPALGNAPQLLSEKSVRSQSQKGDRGAFVYQDNIEKSKEFTAEILVDLIPRIIDTPQIVKVLEANGQTKDVEVNQKSINEFNQPIVDEETGEKVIVNDLSQGKYTVIASTGPTFDTQREETVAQLIELSAASPLFEELAPDIIADNMNIVGGDEFKQRVRKRAIEAGIAEPTEEEKTELGLDQPQQPDPNQIALLENVQMQTEKLRSDIENQDAKTSQIIADSIGAALKGPIDNLNTMMDALKKQTEIGIPVTPQDVSNVSEQKELVEDSQEAVTQQAPIN